MAYDRDLGEAVLFGGCGFAARMRVWYREDCSKVPLAPLGRSESASFGSGGQLCALERALVV